MIAGHFKRALEDIVANPLISTLAVATIALSILIVGAAVLIAQNTDLALQEWKRSVRVMAYLASDPPVPAAELARRIEALEGVASARFIARDDALSELKVRMANQASLLENLIENPLPDAFEIRLKPDEQGWERLEGVAAHLRTLPGIGDVEYGRQWAGAARDVARLLRTGGMVMSGLFLAAALAIVANTIRLVVTSRREEVEVMRWVGASEPFVRAPFYIAGLVQGLVGAGLGLGALYAAFDALSTRPELAVLAEFVPFRFLTPAMIGAILAASTAVGALGAHLSLGRRSSA
ncbi:MAG: ABC transporter permease [Desulfobacteraceae bacterium]|nr:MAG: ABC transporter permease [Desulfobacteraceae bacterium]